MIQSGSIIKWHKTQGEFVNYGDDLVDVEMHVEGRSLKSLKERIQNLTEATRLKAEDLFIREEFKPGSGVFFRITSSDMGVIRKVYAWEGMSKDVGELLAVLTSDENESIDELNLALTRTSTFRVVANIIF